MENERIDVDRLVRRAQSAAGRWPLTAFERLESLLSSVEGSVDWRVRAWKQARAQGGHDTFLGLSLQATLAVPCIRCLGPVVLPVDDEREFLLVPDEETAQLRDDPDASFDVVAADIPFRLAELVEDELILAIPPMPRHDSCQLPINMTAAHDAGLAASSRRAFEDLPGLMKTGADPAADK